MAVSGNGASGPDPHFIRRRHVVLIDDVTFFLQRQERTPFYELHTETAAAILKVPPTSLIVVPHAVTGNWKMAKAVVKSTGAQEGSLVSSRLIESTSMCGQVASRATTTTNWPSLVHCTVTARGGEAAGGRVTLGVHERPQSAHDTHLLCRSSTEIHRSSS